MHRSLRLLTALTLALAIAFGAPALVLADEDVVQDAPEVIAEASTDELQDELEVADPVTDDEATIDEAPPEESEAVEPAPVDEPVPADEPAPAEESAAQEIAPLGATAPEQDDVPLTARERGTGWYVDGTTLYITGTVPDWTDDDGSFPPWAFVSDITSVSIKPGAKVYTCERMFQDQDEITSLDLRNLDTSQVTSFLGMFWNCYGLKTINLTGLNTSRATSFALMFSSCTSLTSIDLSPLNASRVVSVSSMFSGCRSLTSVNLSSLKSAPLQYASSMFSGCTSLTSIDLSPFKGKSLYVAGMFYDCYCLKSVDFSGITVVTDYYGQLGTEGALHGCSNLESFTIPTSWEMSGRRWHSMGGYWYDVNDSIPAATTSNGKWWSVRDKRWYTVAQIKTQRQGIADTYKNDDGTGAYATRPIYRMYNTRTSEHLYTTSAKEYASCGSGNYRDWEREGVAWRAPKKSSKPVYRLYNVKSGDHHYTTSAGERNKLLASGAWRDEGVAFYSVPKGSANAIPLYRVYNGRLKRGQHHYTRSAGERDALVSQHGWRNEGVGFYGYKA